MSAMELKNYAYAIQLAQQILQSLPDFLDGRKLARKAAFEKARTAKKGFLSLGGLGGGTSKASGLLKKGILPVRLRPLRKRWPRIRGASRPTTCSVKRRSNGILP